MALISYLRWVVLWNVVLCSWCRFRFWSRPTIRPTRSGVSPFPGPAESFGPGSLAPRDSAPLGFQAHREREQAQGTLGTADHDTRAPEAGQSRVPHMHGHAPAAVHRGGLGSDNDGPFDGKHFHLAETICLPRPTRGSVPIPECARYPSRAASR